jgi:hypothetical protein
MAYKKNPINKFKNFLAFSVAIVIVFALGIIIGSKYILSEPSQLNSLGMNEEKNQASLISGSCNTYECLFEFESDREKINGISTFTGYYTKINKQERGGQNVQCDAFVVTGGSRILSELFKSAVEEGNTLNQINENGDLVLNISPEVLNSSERSLLYSSSATNPVNIGIFYSTPPGMDANACTSLVKIMSIEQ